MERDYSNQNKVMMKLNCFKSIALVLCFLVAGLASAQEKKASLPSGRGHIEKGAGQKSDEMSAPLFKRIIHTGSSDKWAISVKPTFNRKHYTPEIMQIKESKLQEKLASYKESEEGAKSSMATDPIVGTNFEANWSLVGTPPDNSMAISNAGMIVTANNDGIEYYNSSGSFLYFDFWSDFFGDNSLTSSIYDPKVIYDSGSDRFVLVVLHGTSASTSKVLVCFSQSNNPEDGWWTYQLTGNPLSNNCWFDFPNVGVSNNEIYVTGNLFTSGDNVFNQAVIYQIPKAPAYAGNSLNWQYWANLSATPYPAFTLVPASYGHQGNYGPGIYFVSNEPGPENRIRLWDLTDDMSGNPSLNTSTINTTAYSPSPDAQQLGSSELLSNGDCRIQSAFYLNGIVHYVFNANVGSGWNGIVYNRLTISSGTNQSSTFGLPGSADYSYPAVASFSTSTTDKSVMIAFLGSSPSFYPEVRVVNCDNNMQWSGSALVKAGETYVDFVTGDERWGDYTGISRKHNSSSPSIWLAGCYGANIESQGFLNTWKTWVAEVSGSATVGLDDGSASSKAVSVFPNPAYDLINVYFTSHAFEKTTIEILDMSGRMVKTLYSDAPKVGENKLTFNKGVLPSGTYFVRISTPSKILQNEKLIILN
jgi:hypothetical protein